jgi:hypothetical protein
MGNQQPSSFRMEKVQRLGFMPYTQVSGSGRVPMFIGIRYSLSLGESLRSLNGFYVYVFLNPLKPGPFSYGEYTFEYEPFYVGKGSGRRVKYHFYDRTRENVHKKNTIKGLAAKGLKPIVLLQDSLSEEQAFEYEKILIEAIGRDVSKQGPLTNILIGGEGTSGLHHTEETKIKLRKSCKGKIRTEEHKKQIGIANSLRQYNPATAKKASDRMKGKNNPNYQNKLSENLAYRANLSKGMKETYAKGRKPIQLERDNRGRYIKRDVENSTNACN